MSSPFEFEIILLHKNMWLEMIFFLDFLRPFDVGQVHNMMAIMLNPHFKPLCTMDNLVCHGNVIQLAFKYHVKVGVLILMLCFDWLNTIIIMSIATIIDVMGLELAKSHLPCFGVMMIPYANKALSKIYFIGKNVTWFVSTTSINTCWSLNHNEFGNNLVKDPQESNGTIVHKSFLLPCLEQKSYHPIFNTLGEIGPFTLQLWSFQKESSPTRSLKHVIIHHDLV